MVIFKSQLEAQRFIVRMVARGYHHWLSDIAKDRAALDKRAEKYAEVYGCDLSPSKKSYRRKCQLANTHFIAVPMVRDHLEGGYRYFLLATDGAGPIRENGKLKDARDKNGRLEWDDYVLYLAPRDRREGGGFRWSFYLSKKTEKELDYYVGQLLKKSPHELPAFFTAQCRRPMHHGIRHQVSRLLKRAVQNYERIYPGRKWEGRDPNKPLPSISSF